LTHAEKNVPSDFKKMKSLLQEIKHCRICEKHLDPNPVFAVSKQSKIIIIGQAPGRIVHSSGIAWSDKSGDNLRKWLGVDKTAFYDTSKFGIIPMGFCFPGKGKGGDLPPRAECAPLWHRKLLKQMSKAELTILIGQYAQGYYLDNKKKATLTDTVRNYNSYLPDFFVLPHPSPRNNIWMAKNKWFERDVLPVLKKSISEILN
jgi:uracil-DNA glycosylase